MSLVVNKMNVSEWSLIVYSEFCEREWAERVDVSEQVFYRMHVSEQTLAWKARYYTQLFKINIQDNHERTT